MKKDENEDNVENELPSEVTKRQLKIGIVVTAIGIPIFHFLLSATENMSKNALYEFRSGKAIIETMHAVAPPWFWTLLLLCPLIYEIVRLSIQYVRQKKEEKGEVEEE